MNLVVLNGKILVEGQDFSAGAVRDGSDLGFRIKGELLKEGDVIQTFFTILGMIECHDVFDVVKNDKGVVVIRKRPLHTTKYCCKCKKLVIEPQLKDEEEELCEKCAEGELTLGECIPADVGPVIARNRCAWFCKGCGDQCRLERGHDGGHSMVTCSDNEGMFDALALRAELGKGSDE